MLFPPMPTRKTCRVLAFLVRPTHFFQCDCIAVDGHDGFFSQRPTKTVTGYGSPIHGGGGAPAQISDNSTRPNGVMVCVPSSEDCVAKTKISLPKSLQSGIMFLGRGVAHATRPFVFCG